MSEQVMRPAVATLTQFKKPPAEYTLREAIEFWKVCVKNVDLVLGSQPTGRELSHINEQWVVLIAAIAEREGVGAGLIAYILDETAKLEFQLAETAAAELKEATT